MVDRFGLGWSYILIMAAVSSMLVLAVLLWMWPRMFERFPYTKRSYGCFYKSVLCGAADWDASGSGKAFVTGAFIGIICIAAYAAITSKLFTGIWNLAVLAFGITTGSFLLLVAAKTGLAALVGLSMFFVYPYLFHRLYSSSG